MLVALAPGLPPLSVQPFVTVFNRRFIATRLRRWWLCVFFSPALAGAAPVEAEAARDYLIHTWRTDDGLPQNWVSSITQTPDGYLWIGTRYGGLARFDGVRFVHFNQQNTPALKDVQVEHLTVDETGTLWIIMGNESVTALKNGRFQLYRQPRSDPRLRMTEVLRVQTNQVLFAGEFPYLARLNLTATSNQWTVLDPQPSTVPRPETFVIDKDKIVWFVTQAHRLGKYEGDSFERRALFPGQPGPVATDVAVDARGDLWLATRQHLASWNGRTFVEQTPTNGPPPTDIVEIAFSGDGDLWVLEKNRLRKWFGGQWVAEAQPWNFPADNANNSAQLHGDARGGAWLVSYGHGLWHVKPDGTASQLTERDGLPSSLITCWFQDREGNIWIGTAGGGIARIRESVFQVFSEAQGMPGKVVRSVCQDALGNIWAGTMAGSLARLTADRFVKVPLPVVGDSPLESVTVVPGTNHSIWVGSLNHGLMQREASGNFRPLVNQPFGNSIRVLYTDRHQQLWVGGLVNLFQFTGGNSIKQFGATDGFTDGHAIGALAEDAAGALWIGTGPGELWKYESNRFTCHTPPKEWPAVRFSALLPDTNGTIWVGTLGGGLLCFQDGKFTRCTTEQGLPDNNVSQLLDSGDGNLWAGTYAGIFHARKADLLAAAAGAAPRVPCRVYGHFEGLPALECSSGFQPSCWQATDGRLWFATANGVVSINPAEIRPNRQPPSVIIEELLVDGEPLKLPPVNERSHPAGGPATGLQIKPGRHYLQFRFTGLNFAAPDGVRFRVKLEGADTQWRDIGGERLAGYGPLLPGNYHFRVIACNNDGIWNEQGDTLAFAVQPYVWQTWWFKAASGLLALAGLGVIVALVQRQRYRRRLELAERQREMEHERTRIARDLHDDLGTSLTQISLLSALANREQTPPDEAKELIQQVRGRARAMVIALDEIVWAVNPKNDSLPGLASYLGHFAEEFFRPTGIRCRLDIPEQLPPHPLSAELRHHLFLAFKEAANNVARHSRAKQVRVRVEPRPAEVVIYLEDDGCGLKTAAASSRQGNGLLNMQRRMEQMGGTAELQSLPGQGTTVAFHVPLK